jgi:serine/threonine-protein kinase
MGTVDYMAPEQGRNTREADARCDIYSLGGVAYYLVTGRLPFERETLMEMVLAHARDPVIPPRAVRAEVPADLEAVILRCLEKDPGRRFPDAESLDKALAACQCAGTWTPERAAAAWQKQASELLVSSPPDPGTDPRATVLVNQQTPR